jgi:hypothetical protein
MQRLPREQVVTGDAQQDTLDAPIPQARGDTLSGLARWQRGTLAGDFVLNANG